MTGHRVTIDGVSYRPAKVIHEDTVSLRALAVETGAHVATLLRIARRLGVCVVMQKEPSHGQRVALVSHQHGRCIVEEYKPRRKTGS